MTIAALEAQGLTRRYGKTLAVDALDLTLGQGECLALLGPAGAGKTTTLRLIAGLEVPDTGRVLIGGRDATALEPKDRDLAMIFDTIALYPNKTGRENIASPLRIRRLPEEEIRARVDAVARVLQVVHILDRKPRTMSGGERQRIALGRALVRDPAAFLLDEPLSSLDAKLRVELRAELRRLQRERGAAFLYATPDFQEAMAVADRVAVILGGAVRQIAPPQQVYDEPADRDVAAFVGAPRINLLPAAYDPAEGGTLRVAGLTLPASPRHRALFGATPTRFEIGLRPEAVALTAPGAVGASGRIVDSEPLGTGTAITVETADGPLRAAVPERDAAELGLGATVALSLDLTHGPCFAPADGRLLA